ncbi:MAG: hypothetical protein LH614_18325 [Pyrinomonadaceae bacterium]|nr:hypothetical protein [Pyrinomonadaceae bacterium]
MNNQMREKLLEMRALDERVREELAKTGELFDGYCPKMEVVHLENAAALEKMIAENGGWLGKSVVGKDGVDAAWLIVQHAISLPGFSRRCLESIENSVAENEAAAQHAAMLRDRIKFFEGKPQRYGTQSDWNKDGVMEVWTLENEGKVNDFRAAVGLEPLENLTWETEETRENAPPNYAERQRDFKDWAEKVGWRK